MDASIDERADVDLASGWSRSPARAAARLVYFGSEVRDASTVKRVQQFIDFLAANIVPALAPPQAGRTARASSAEAPAAH